MRTAVVFAARQPVGFELCKQLLETGHVVHAVDHERWITEEQEEKWLYIGRNANLHYHELGKADEESDESLEQLLLPDCAYFLPVIDYLNRDGRRVQGQMLKQLAFLLKRITGEAIFIFLQPSSVELVHASFANKIHHLNRSLRDNSRTMTYLIMDSPEKEEVLCPVFFQAGDRAYNGIIRQASENQNGTLAARVKIIIDDLEQREKSGSQMDRSSSFSK